MIMRKILNGFYSVMLLLLCAFAFSNCSDDDGEEVGNTGVGITAISSETAVSVSVY